MFRIIVSELWRRRSRTLAMLAGILVATTAFTVLTGASETQRLVVTGTVAKNYRTSYDLLVRPKGSRTPEEISHDLVRPGAISGISGGITVAQWQRVLHTPGVSVAAPIAVVGYVLPESEFPIDLTPYLGTAQRALFRVNVERITDDGLTRQADAPLYVYVTRDAMVPAPEARDPSKLAQWAPEEILQSGNHQPVCAESGGNSESAFDPLNRGGDDALGNVDCWSLKDGLEDQTEPNFAPFPTGHFGALIPLYLPSVLAAVDPTEQSLLDGLNASVVSGRYLRSDDQPSHPFPAYPAFPAVPVIASSQPYADESVVATVERLPSSSAQRLVQGAPILGTALATFLAAQPGEVVMVVNIGAQQAQNALLTSLAGPADSLPLITAYWSVGTTTYQNGANGQLIPKQVSADPSIWQSFADGGFIEAPLSAEDKQFRALTEHQSPSMYQLGEDFAFLHSVGVFDPAKLPGFTGALTNVLDTFRFPGLAPIDASTAGLSHGQPLLPNGNLGGYLTQPPLLVTDLASLPAFEEQNFQPNSQAAPISAIQVRVSGVVGIDPVSRERVRLTAQRIETATGLQVDITAGSSPSPQTIELPAGRFGRPILALSEPWVKIGVALTILKAIDQKSLVLFVLILVVCALFVTNAASAAVRGRRTELGVLAALGWTTPRLFGAVLGEVAAVGLVAGLAGAAIAVPLAHLVGLSASVSRAALAVPAALLLAVLAGLTPAIRAARVQPIAAVRPAVLETGRAWRPRHIGQLAVVNLLRVPGRSALGALSLAIGVCALTLLLAATVAFGDLLVGSVLGGVVSVEVHGSDFVAVVTIVALGIAAVADVLFLNLRERAGEMATLRAMGWDEVTIIRLVVLEGLWLGLAGSLVGGGLGLAAAAILVGGIPAGLVFTTLLAMGTGTVLAGLVAVAPAVWVRRLSTVELLAQE